MAPSISRCHVGRHLDQVAGRNQLHPDLFLGNQHAHPDRGERHLRRHDQRRRGNGGLTLTGGTETITGSIGYSGATTVNGGTLVVNSSLASSSGLTVNTGGTLTGTGTVGNTSIAGGTFAPGSGTPGSSMTVNGTLGFTAASTYAVNINPTTSSFANVTGTATLGGATVNAIYASGSYVAEAIHHPDRGQSSAAASVRWSTPICRRTSRPA